MLMEVFFRVIKLLIIMILCMYILIFSLIFRLECIKNLEFLYKYIFIFLLVYGNIILSVKIFNKGLLIMLKSVSVVYNNMNGVLLRL